MKRLERWIEQNPRAVAGGLVAGMGMIAWYNRFVQDDAFIVFRYAENLVRGHGLVFNPGERVEGYTCFLHTLLMALGIRLGAEPVIFSQALGLAFFVCSLVGIARLGLAVTGDRRVGLLAMVLAGLHYSFSIYATGGLETSLLTALVTWTLALGLEEALAPRADLARRVGISLLAALALMTRLDAVLLLAPVGAWLLFTPRAGAGSDSVPGPGVAARLAALVMPMGLILATWFAWKRAYYGSLLPATFYAKAGDGVSIGPGLRYLYRFVESYWLPAPLLLAAWGARRTFAGTPMRVLMVSVGLLVVYVLRIGGDFMEFRLLVPVIPILAILLARAAAWLEERAGLGAMLVVLVVAGSLHHAVVFNRTSHHGTESVHHLMSHLYQGDQDWTGIGAVLAREFGNDQGLVISTTAIGAIPYYSRAVTVDQLGLTDLETARHGILDPTRMPGHRRMASMDHLIECRVNLVIGHPQLFRETLPDTIYREDHAVPTWLAGDSLGSPVPPGLVAVEIPIEEGWRLLALYLTPRASVDEAIRRNHWRVHPVASRQAGR